MFVAFANFSALVSLLRGCPQLRHLSLLCEVVDKEGEPASPWHGKCDLELEELKISLGSAFGPNFLAEEFLEWMGENVEGRVRVNSLKLGAIMENNHHQEDLVIIQRLVDALSMSLEELEVCYDVPSRDPQISKVIYPFVRIHLTSITQNRKSK